MNNTDRERTPSRGLCLLTAASGLELLYCGLLLDGSISAFFPLGDMEATVAVFAVAAALIVAECAALSRFGSSCFYILPEPEIISAHFQTAIDRGAACTDGAPVSIFP